MSNQFPTAVQLGQAIGRGELSPVDLAEQALSQAEQFPEVYLNVLRERALCEAELSTWRRDHDCRLGPLDGVPIAWKDLFDVAGEVTTAGGRVFTEPALRDAEVVRRAGQAGLVSVGKTNLTELAFSGLGMNPHYGTPDATPGNGEQRVPGGSSSGSAVAVAKGLIPVAAGTDTAGSLRIPAAFNGLVSYRPTTGHHPAHGVVPLGRSLDTPGVIARTLEDCLAVDDVFCGKSGVQRQALVTDQVTVVLDEQALDDESLEESVRAATRAYADRLESKGIRVVRKAVPVVEQCHQLTARLGWLGGFEALAEYRDLLASLPAERFDPRVRDRILAFEHRSPADVVQLYRERRYLQQVLVEQLGSAVLLSPTVARIAPLLGPLLLDDDAYRAANTACLRLSMVASLLDSPAITVPAGVDLQGQFMGVQLMGLAGQDEHLKRSVLAL
ncbi:amidase family protein [Saccharospirillum impatiens]|uniref:amidase family protein n=1 Tax=Saccharospirillum impatiens TaxID=169438 RepID=UPI00040DC7FF|nr:amidase family protein [Saccharospirillum impatiens]